MVMQFESQSSIRSRTWHHRCSSVSLSLSDTMPRNLVLENRTRHILKRKFLSLSEKVKQTPTVIHGMKSCTSPLSGKQKSNPSHRKEFSWPKVKRNAQEPTPHGNRCAPNLDLSVMS